MNSYGENNHDSDVMRKILRLLTPKFNYIVCSIEKSNNTNALTIDEFQMIWLLLMEVEDVFVELEVEVVVDKVMIDQS